MSNRRPKKKITLRVGAFVLVGIIFIFAYILLLGQNRTYFNFVDKYKVLLSKVDGLFIGSVVKVNGVPAGNVFAIDFIPETGDLKVEVSILRKFSPVITDQSGAFLATKGLLGDKYIAIKTRGQRGKRLPKNSYIPTLPPPGLVGFLGQQKTGDKVSAILDEVLTFTRALNSENTAKKASRVAEKISETLSTHQKDISQILGRLNSILTKIDDGEGTVGALINNKNIYHRILSLLGSRPYHKYIPSLLEDPAQGSAQGKSINPAN